MSKYDNWGENYPAETRYFGGEVFELYDHPKVSEGATKRVAQSVAKELRKYGNRARVVKSKNKWWVYWS